MELRPDINRLMRREIYTILTITLVVMLATFIIQALVVNLDPEVENAEFVQYVWSWVAGALIAMWVVAPWLIYLWITNLSYSIEEERVVIHKGIVTKKSISIPYAAITDFTLSRSLYERWLEIGTLLIQTAGQGAQAGGHEGRMEGLVDFEGLHKSLRARVKAISGQGPEAGPNDPKHASPDLDVMQAILDEVKKINRKLD